MKLIVIGSKIMSDALSWEKINYTRITNISPFVFNVNRVFSKNNEIALDRINSDSFLNSMNRMEISGVFDNIEEKWDRCLVDCADMRMQFTEYIFEDGDILRLTCSNYTEKINVSELVTEKIVVSSAVINPMKLSREELKREIYDFLSFLHTIPVNEILFCDTRFPIQKLGQNGILQLVDDLAVKCEYNNFLKLCSDIFKENWKGKFCTLPENAYRDENLFADRFWGVNKIYYRIISDFALDKSETMSHYSDALEKELNIYIYKAFQEQYGSKTKNKRIICVGKNFFPEHINNIRIVSQEELKKPEEYQGSFVVINPLCLNDGLPEIIKGLSLIPEKEFGIPGMVSYEIKKDFQGEITDVFGNQIIIKSSGVHLKLNGSGNHVLIEDTTSPRFIDGCLHNFSNITVKSDFEGIVNITMANFTNLYIDSNTSFRKGSIVDMGCFGRIRIGKECMFSSYVKISDKKYNIQLIGNFSSYGDAVEIGNHVWGGYNCSCISGAKVGDGCIIAAKAVVDRDHFQYKNSMLVGNPARIRKLGGVSWDRDFCATERAFLAEGGSKYYAE